MILIRRLLAIFLFVLFIPIFLVTMVLWHTQSTLFEPEYLKRELADTDIYNFIYDQAMEPILRDQLADRDFLDALPEELQDFQFRPASDAHAITGMVRDFMPPEEMQIRVEHVIDEALPYVTGDTDEMAITLGVADRIRTWPELFKLRLDELQAGERLVASELAPKLRDALNSLSKDDRTGFQLNLTDDQAESIALDVVAPEWIESQTVSTLDGVARWLIRDTENLEVTIQFADRIPKATAAIKEVMDAANAEEFLFQQVIEPELTDALGPVTQVTAALDITDDEVTDALRLVAPPAWIREQRNGLLDVLSGYISGAEDDLGYRFDLAKRIPRASEQLVTLAGDKIASLVGVIPGCGNLADTAAAAQALAGGELPGCKPSQITAGAITDTLTSGIDDQVEQLIVANIPSEIVFTRNDLEDIVGREAFETLDDVRQRVSEGFRITDESIEDFLLDQNLDFSLSDLDVLRDTLSDGYTLTQVDVEDRLFGDRPDLRDDVEQGRKLFGQARDLFFLIFVLLGLFVLMIAFLGGRNWISRLRWGAAPVAFVALAAWIAIGPVYDNFAGEWIDKGRTDFGKEFTDATTRLVAVEAYDKVVFVAERWKVGFGNLSRNIGFAAVIVLILSFALSIFGSSRGGKKPASPAYSPTAQQKQSDDAYAALTADRSMTDLRPTPDDN